MRALTLVLVACGFAASAARAADLPPLKSCTAAMTNDEKPLSPRDLVVARNGNVVSWSLCYVSDQAAIANMNVQLSGFDKSGALISLNGQARGYLPKTNRSGDISPDVPPIVDTASVQWSVPVGIVLSDYFLIALAWTPCAEQPPPTSTSCAAGQPVTTTFLRRVKPIVRGKSQR
jgi:hypothetical protein